MEGSPNKNSRGSSSQLPGTEWTPIAMANEECDVLGKTVRNVPFGLLKSNIISGVRST
jgi:hypothetical protein